MAIDFDLLNEIESGGNTQQGAPGGGIDFDLLNTLEAEPATPPAAPQAPTPSAPAANEVPALSIPAAKEYMRGFVGSALQQYPAAIKGAAELNPVVKAVGKFVPDAIADTLSPTYAMKYWQEFGDDPTVKAPGEFIPRAFGSVATQVPVTVATGGAATLPFNVLSGAGFGAQEAEQTAAAKGEEVDPLKRTLAAIGYGLLGATEAPIIDDYAKLALKAAGPAKIINAIRGLPLPDWAKGRVAEIALTTGKEAAQETVQTAGENLVAQTVFDPERKILEGTGEAGAGGGIVGATMEAALGKRGRVRGTPAATAPAEGMKPDMPALREEARRVREMGARPAPAAPAPQTVEELLTQVANREPTGRQKLKAAFEDRLEQQRQAEAVAAEQKAAERETAKMVKQSAAQEVATLSEQERLAAAEEDARVMAAREAQRRADAEERRLIAERKAQDEAALEQAAEEADRQAIATGEEMGRIRESRESTRRITEQRQKAIQEFTAEHPSAGEVVQVASEFDLPEQAQVDLNEIRKENPKATPHAVFSEGKTYVIEETTQDPETLKKALVEEAVWHDGVLKLAQKDPDLAKNADTYMSDVWGRAQKLAKKTPDSPIAKAVASIKQDYGKATDPAILGEEYIFRAYGDGFDQTFTEKAATKVTAIVNKAARAMGVKTPYTLAEGKQLLQKTQQLAKRKKAPARAVPAAEATTTPDVQAKPQESASAQAVDTPAITPAAKPTTAEDIAPTKPSVPAKKVAVKKGKAAAKPASAPATEVSTTETVMAEKVQPAPAEKVQPAEEAKPAPAKKVKEAATKKQAAPVQATLGMDEQVAEEKPATEEQAPEEKKAPAKKKKRSKFSISTTPPSPMDEDQPGGAAQPDPNATPANTAKSVNEILFSTMAGRERVFPKEKGKKDSKRRSWFSGWQYTKAQITSDFAALNDLLQASEDKGAAATTAQARIFKVMDTLKLSKEESKEYAELSRKAGELSAKLEKARDEGADADVIQRLEAELDTTAEQILKNPLGLGQKMIMTQDLFHTSDPARAVDGVPAAIPGGITHDQISSLRGKLMAAIDNSKDKQRILDFIKAHYDFAWENGESMKRSDFRFDGHVTNPFYYPHQVMDFFSRWNGVMDPDTGLPYRGYAQKRKGSERLIEMDYLQAMYRHAMQVELHNAGQNVYRYIAGKDKASQLIDEKLEEYAKEIAEVNRLMEEEGVDIVDAVQAQPKTFQQAYMKARAEVFREARAGKIPGMKLLKVDRRLVGTTHHIMLDMEFARQVLGFAANRADVKAMLAEIGYDPEYVSQEAQTYLERELVVPEELAEMVTEHQNRRRKILDEFKNTSEFRARVNRYVKNVFQAIKEWKLFGAFSRLRYEYGNTSTDFFKLGLDANDKTWRRLPTAAWQLVDYYRTGKMTPELEAAIKARAISGFTDQISGGTGQLTGAIAKMFDDRTTIEKMSIKSLVKMLYAKDLTTMREGIFRYAKFLEAYNDLQSGNTPDFQGANANDAMALRDMENLEDAETVGERRQLNNARIASFISRHTFGDYAARGERGKAVSTYILPFFGWTEVNLKYHYNLFENQKDLFGKAKAGGSIAVGALRHIGWPLFKMLFPYLALDWWNHRNEEVAAITDTANAYDRARLRMTTLDGDVVYIPTALSDVLDTFGGPNLMYVWSAWQQGRITAADAFQEIAKAPVNKVVQGIWPAYKAIFTGATGIDLFPDTFEPKKVKDYDRWWVVAEQVTDKTTAQLLRKNVDEGEVPANTKGEVLTQVFLQQRARNPERQAQNRIAEILDNWVEQNVPEKNRDATGSEQATTQYMRSFKRAMHRGDYEAMTRMMKLLMESNYTQKQFEASIKASNPLYRLNAKEKAAFEKSLTDREKIMLRMAVDQTERDAAMAMPFKSWLPKRKPVQQFDPVTGRKL